MKGPYTPLNYSIEDHRVQPRTCSSSFHTILFHTWQFQSDYDENHNIDLKY